ncbi:hypothetical protein QTJ16_000404 [Diplocarpon rosae]|uniref:Pre-mRNA-splicing factor cwc26 n=1 Tax=Diplocarpon rosae TaxID=946125 RepID=A0AAD9WHI9_9HELO|nr:hypothetical protein QTJ16_000404 [Diplocarpon rosae]
MSLASYLASKYLTADSSSTSSGKKRKRKTPKECNGLIIADDDALGWTATTSTNADDDTPLTISSGSADFRKTKKNAWKIVGVPALQPKDADSEAADRILAEAAQEKSAALHEDEGPVVEDDGVVKMGDGTHAGLQSAKAVAAQFEKRKREEAAAWEREQAASGLGGGKIGKRATQETVYRDATGRRIDISMRRQEARREADAKLLKEREELEAQKGDVQRAAKEKRREDLDEARFMPVARGIDDVEMNDELKEVERWNDPAAQFLAKKTGGKNKSSKWTKQTYNKAAPPNRYGIRPGYKWDGVDRGNGWESERFKALNRAQRNKDLDYAWQEDT